MNDAVEVGKFLAIFGKDRDSARRLKKHGAEWVYRQRQPANSGGTRFDKDGHS